MKGASAASWLLAGISLAAFSGQREAVSTTKKMEARKPAKSGEPRVPQSLNLGLRFDAPAGIRPVPVLEATLSNGLRILLAENHDLPSVSVMALVRAGRLYDPPGALGAAYLISANIATAGSRLFSSSETRSLVQPRAARLESSLSDAFLGLTLRCRASDLAALLPLFVAHLTQPAFEINELETAKNRLRASIGGRNSDLLALVRRSVDEQLFGLESPYARRVENAHIDDIERDDLVRFQRRYFFPRNMILAGEGDFDSAVLKTLLEKSLGGWDNNQPPVAPLPDPPPPAPPSVAVHDAGDPDRGYFAIGERHVSLTDPDRAALDVAAILAANAAARTMTALAAQPRSLETNWLDRWDRPEILGVTGSVRPFRIVFYVQTVREALTRLRSQPVSAEDLDYARILAAQNWVFRFSRPVDILRGMALADLLGVPRKAVLDYPRAVAAVSQADIQRVARSSLHPDQMHIAVVGPRAFFDSPLEQLGLPVKVMDVAIPPSKLREPPTDEASVQAGQEAVRKMLAALGGLERLAAVRDFSLVLEGRLETGGAQTPIRQTVRWIRPAVFRQDQQIPGGQVSVYYDGKIGWISQRGRFMSLTPEMVQQIRGELFRLPYNLLVNASREGYLVSLIGSGAVYISNRKDQSVRISIDSETGLPVKYTYQGYRASETLLNAQELIREWKEVEGIQVPAKFSLQQGGRVLAEYDLIDVKFNTGVTEEDLIQRP